MDVMSQVVTLSGMLLAGAGNTGRVAIVAGEQRLTYDDLAQRVDARRAEIALPERSIATLTGDHSIEFVVTYLALLESGHVPLLAGAHGDRLTEAWPVGAVLHATDESVDIEVRRRHDADELHPDLALLLSTSGSTGSPKLVRLSHRNLVENARSIAEYLRLTPEDRGITSLPLHYCYGLSVLHSHLLVGASVVLTNTSVVDRCFRSALLEHGVTNLAGVPHTYEMLERTSPEELASSSLRLLTQAGGRMTPDAVTRWAERVEGWGAEFVVMYGQTEATARIAYLPPELARRRPEAIGRPIPGGSLELRPVDGAPAGVGELVYSGANVMMGYAHDVGDLALGNTLTELATGDLARYHAADDVYEIVGRRSRFVKPFGLRIDLDEVESQLAPAAAGELAVAGDDDRVVVHAPGSDIAELRERLSQVTGLPERCCHVHDRPIPRTTSDKVDQAAMLAGDELAVVDESDIVAALPQAEAPVVAIFASVLGVADVDDNDTFVSLGGDSLNYVECSIRLEAALGQLPSDWHLQPIASLASSAEPRRRWARIDTTVALRAIGICLVVATHMRISHVPGGAHTLLAVAGYNVARFMAPLPTPAERIRAGLRTASRAAIPTMVWVAVGMVAFGSYSVGTLLLVNNYVGPSSHADDHWHFWFIEVFVHLVLLASLLTTVPVIRRLDRRFVYLVPLAALGVALVFRMEWAQMDDWYNLRYRTHGVAWFFALGWLIQRSSTWRQRALTSAVAAATVFGFFDLASREWRILILLGALVWLRELPVPRWSVRVIGTLAAASMWIYVSHFSIWPLFRMVFVREVAYVLTIVSGVAVWFVAERLLGFLNDRRQQGWWRPTAPGSISPRSIAGNVRPTPRLQHRGTP